MSVNRGAGSGRTRPGRDTHSPSTAAPDGHGLPIVTFQLQIADPRLARLDR
ncbi:hypothetical protein ACFY1U_12220 [Streptomyces sp. NPDC001351]|uniref:hypothetical protein n=1 Tax=Streptomyces sp. NPDC001351 TaxID=3364564 RepID=UPI0036C35E6A